MLQKVLQNLFFQKSETVGKSNNLNCLLNEFLRCVCVCVCGGGEGRGEKDLEIQSLLYGVIGLI